ncbi:hypothetical protein GE061_015107 [Apolygus lucorum]|uniref:CHK kinase-like domain-containing protein n=1 Tax=Apolygus lucorum TaxID=248454 RepID=A0A8S9XJY6_APOLU|nr:hypothetical protein GE061_015107 [Apolygus lucorum]
MTEQKHDLDLDQLKIFLKNHYHNEKIAEVISCSKENAVPDGTNFASLVHRIKFLYLNNEGRKRTKSVIVKTESINENNKDVVKPQAFAPETKMYRTILPIMEDLMEEVGDKRDLLWPKFLGFVPYDMIAFEDLLDMGYSQPKRKQCFDYSHAKLALRSIGRFHAMSKVLMARGHIAADDGKSLGITKSDSMTRRGWDVVLTVMTDDMTNNWGEEWKGLADRLRSQATGIPGKLHALGENYDTRFKVMNHGDLWFGNLIFKYMDGEEHLPISVKIIDYQDCHINSFIYAQFAYTVVHVLMTAEVDKALDVAKMKTHSPHEIVDKTVFSDGKVLNCIGEDLKFLVGKGVI